MSSSWDGRSACKVFQPPYNVASFGFLVDQPDSKGSLHATPHPIQQNQMLSYEELSLVPATPPANGLKPCHICNAVKGTSKSEFPSKSKMTFNKHVETTKK